MDLARVECEREALKDGLVANGCVKISDLEHLLFNFHAVRPALPKRNRRQEYGMIEKQDGQHPQADRRTVASGSIGQ